MKTAPIDKVAPAARQKRMCKGTLKNGKPCQRERIKGQRLCSSCRERVGK